MINFVFPHFFSAHHALNAPLTESCSLYSYVGVDGYRTVTCSDYEEKTNNSQ